MKYAAAIQYARECKTIWHHLDEDDQQEQIESHMLSQRFSVDEIECAMADVGFMYA